MRVESSYPAPNGAGWLHPRDGVPNDVYIPPPKPKVSNEELAQKFSPLAKKFADCGLDRIRGLALDLRLNAGVLNSLGVGYDENDGSWTFPERTANGLVVGIVRRLAVVKDGHSKLCIRGSRRGLSYCDGWNKSSGPIFIVEGPTDCAAGIGMELAILGRPSNTGGIAMLTDMLQSHKNRRVIIVGENDKKDLLAVQQSNARHNLDCNGCLCCFPGLAGAKQTARSLAKRLGRSIDVVMPGTAKDLRAWFIATGVNPNDVQACRELGWKVKRGKWD